jgi:uncharacterized protein (DUF1684 family)
MPLPSGDLIALADWRRQIAGLYRDVREQAEPEDAWHHWRQVRDNLFGNHAQSPLPEPDRNSFSGLQYYPYDPEARVLAEIENVPPERYEIPSSGEGTYAFIRFATVGFQLYGESLHLELYWMEGYAGGIFLSFRDETSGRETYGAGRYLLDTIKGADLGTQRDKLILDFNFAYNPSCAYNPKWVCPLAPPPNRLSVQVQAGERL